MNVTFTKGGCEDQASPGGKSTKAVTGGVATTQVKADQGRLCRVLATSTGTGAGNVTFYDAATADATGTVIGLVPANAAAGTVYVFDIPAANGIVVVGVANSPNLTVSYN